MDSGKWEEAKRDFVQNGLSPLEICKKYNVDRFELAREMVASKWKMGKEAWTREMNLQGPVTNPDAHSEVADELVTIGREIAKDLQNRKELSDGERKSLRARAETYRTIVEATDRAVRLARDSRGLRLGQPSKKGDDDTTFVNYQIAYDKTTDTQEKKNTA